MATSGSATGGNDVFNGKARAFWWLVSQDYAANTSTIRWAWCVNWAAGDNCHSIRAASFNGNGTIQWSTSNTHDFVSGHVHSGDWPAVNSSSGGGFASGTYVLNHDAAGNANVQVSASHVGTSGATSTATTPVDALPQIPQTPANASACTATRVNDGQINVAWTNNSTGTAPYQNIKVYRKTDGGGWANIATLGVVTSYADTGVVANHKYHYGINVVGANGTEVGTAEAADVWTTPGAPTGCAATKLGNGDISIGWSNNVSFAEYLTEIQESTDGGTTWTNLNTSIAAGSTTYTHVAPVSSVTHRYRVRAKTSSGTALFSSYSAASNTITLLATANAPTGLSPSGAARDAAGNITLSWTHNPADGTPQSKRRVQVKIGAGAFADVVNDTSSTSSFTITAGTWTNGTTITWHVATAGQNGTLSAFSADASFTLSATPTATISTPGATVNNSHADMAWTYFQAQGSAQASFTAQLKDGSGGLVETVVGTTAASAAFAATLANGATYTVTVAVTSAAGLSSATASKTFTVTYLPPAMPHIAAAFDNGSGAMVLTITGDDPVNGVTVAIANVDVQRSINGGPWVTVAAGIVLSGVAGVQTAIVQDTVPITVGSNKYRAIAYSALPSSVMSAVVEVVTAETTWGYLSGGHSFATVARFRATPTYAASTSRAKALYHFAGRPKPVQLAGEALTTTLAVSGKLSSGSGTPADFEALGLAQGVVCWRGPDGRRLFGSVGKMDLGVTRLHALTAVAFTLTEVDFTEGAQ